MRGGAHGVVVFVALLVSGCSGLRARNHPCYPYLQHRYGGHVPPAVADALAKDGGGRKEVTKERAPIGAYWRPQRPLTHDLHDVRLLRGGYELAPCPGLPRQEKAPPPPEQ